MSFTCDRCDEVFNYDEDESLIENLCADCFVSLEEEGMVQTCRECGEYDYATDLAERNGYCANCIGLFRIRRGIQTNDPSILARSSRTSTNASLEEEFFRREHA